MSSVRVSGSSIAWNTQIWRRTWPISGLFCLVILSCRKPRDGEVLGRSGWFLPTRGFQLSLSRILLFWAMDSSERTQELLPPCLWKWQRLWSKCLGVTEMRKETVQANVEHVAWPDLRCSSILYASKDPEPTAKDRKSFALCCLRWKILESSMMQWSKFTASKEMIIPAHVVFTSLHSPEVQRWYWHTIAVPEGTGTKNGAVWGLFAFWYFLMPSETMSQWRYREHVTKSLSGMGFKFHFLQSLEINVRFTCLAPNSPVLPGTSFKHDSSSLFHTLPIHVLCTPLFMKGTRFPMVRILEDEPVLITLFDKSSKST